MAELQNSSALAGPAVKTKRANLTRIERAEIRILTAYGCSPKQISEYIKCSETTVGNANTNLIYAIPDDIDEDYDHVDDSFRSKFPPIGRYLERQDEEERPRRVQSRADRARRFSSASLSGSTPKSVSPPIVDPIQSPSTPARVQPPVKPPLPRRKPPVPPVSLRIPPRPPLPLSTVVDPNPPAPSKAIIDLSDPVLQFLSSLPHDLSSFYPDFKEQSLGTAKELFVFGEWEIVSLVSMLKDTFPKMKMPDIHILARGLKNHKAERV